DLELVALALGLDPVLEAGACDGDGRPEVVGIDGLDEVVEDGRTGRLLHGTTVAVGGEDDDRDGALGRDLVRRLRAGHVRHPNIEESQVRLYLSGEFHGLSTICGRGHDLVTQRFELAGQSEVVQRLVIGDEDAKRLGHGASSFPWEVDVTIQTACATPPHQRAWCPEKSSDHLPTIWGGAP